jgi:TonB family protein
VVAASEASSRESGVSFHPKAEPAKSKVPLFAGLGVLLLAGIIGVYFVMARKRAQEAAAAIPVTTTLSAEAIQLRELQEKLAALEAEKAAAVAKAEEEARKKLEAEAASKGRGAVDPAALQKAQEEARRKAEAEQIKKQEEEKRRLEAEQRATAERLAEEQRRAAEEEAARLAAATTTLPPVTQPPPPAVKAGSLVDLNEAGVIAPVALTKGSLQYPPIALRQRIEGIVEVSVLVDERGSVTDAKVTTQAGGKAGLNEAAVEYVRRWKFRPATKEGVVVKVWAPVSVKFVLPR